MSDERLDTARVRRWCQGQTDRTTELLLAACDELDAQRLANGEVIPPVSPVWPTGRWSVEDGQPYWVDNETNAHMHPLVLRGEDCAREAWYALAEIIWQAGHEPTTEETSR